jgi:hypothetical protein
MLLVSRVSGCTIVFAHLRGAGAPQPLAIQRVCECAAERLIGSENNAAPVVSSLVPLGVKRHAQRSIRDRGCGPSLLAVGCDRHRRRRVTSMGAAEAAESPIAGCLSIQHSTHLAYELRTSERLLDERHTTIDPRPLRGGLLGVA